MLFENLSSKGVANALTTRLVQEIFSDMQRAFPQLVFEFDEASTTVNAQAINHGETRIVRLYGGLPFHPGVGCDGIVFVLLHEAGHHLASGGRLGQSPILACECAADHWVLKHGAAQLERLAGRSLAMDRAVQSLDVLAALQPSLSLASTVNPRICWSWSWSKRKKILTSNEESPRIPQCYLSAYFASHNVRD
jgi:hypothetical protein